MGKEEYIVKIEEFQEEARKASDLFEGLDICKRFRDFCTRVPQGTISGNIVLLDKFGRLLDFYEFKSN